jgi:peroxiredoxin
MFPHERSLVERHKNAPFVLLGVNLDGTRSSLQKTQEKEDLNWRNWWDAEQKISSQWNLQAMPTLYLIDAQGTIRFVHVGTPKESDLDHEIDKLLKEVGK